MTSHSHVGTAVRLNRLSRFRDGRFLFIPLDHSVSDGPIADAAPFRDLVRSLIAGGADALVVHRGRARSLPPSLLAECPVIMHMSASTAQGRDPDEKVLVADVEDAVRLGADAVSVHVNIGSDTEAAQLADLGAVAARCDQWGLPLLAMIYPRGPRVDNPHEVTLLRHVVNIAADLGADLVKTTWCDPAEEMAAVVAGSPIPVLVAGGPGRGADLVAYGQAAMAAGCSGLAIGRRVFQHPQPGVMVRRLAEVVHQDMGNSLTDPLRALAGSS
ncbi:2-amino-3,7-dideoxy-D-threo-hept-6-ulosonate synthase [Amycolatopsis roodepoortensis]|uniref:2-amino-4, 5-dihydroxy-6-oxo-7-(Phosphonooxy)heptanoate synthase n=1 Tax=Amycolatopsis roodepoortensis TaxID=700274 RepID=A0ABR9L121_9PSEU|nr:2-amino-3,7-dideoxy-D-threo-hept-6-ulosonate synthase [Amycolatopsis roodepoortensis]MBE1574308.1 2-amino-4,5-dihydroxy-6-oxo-7-(phosphonooxy)heptanoate synthase [Amycolatopsis roodepoortensis]